mmetsp:Transcript_134733/g.340619  ORF Transcript_134733/g.340619 Transcript_134733/m.340619 type:complete len:383 (-) Transcript_134733:597-1745(-)
MVLAQKKYQPYDLFRMNCQHYAGDLIRYLEAKDGCRGVGCSSLSRGRVLKIVQQDGLELSRVPETLRSDPEIVLTAVEHSEDGLALQYASEALRGNREFVLKAVQICGLALQFASEPLRGDVEVVLASVRGDGMALAYASDALREERRVVLEAVRQNGLAVQHAKESLHGDRAIVSTAKLSAPVAVELLACSGSGGSNSNEDSLETPAVQGTGSGEIEGLLVVVLHARIICSRTGNQLLVKGTGLDGEELCILEVSPRSAHMLLEELVGEKIGRSGKELQFHRSDGMPLWPGLHLGEAWVALHEGKREALPAAFRSSLGLQLLFDDMRANREAVLAAGGSMAETWQHATPTSEADRHVFHSAVHQSNGAWLYVPQELQGKLL